MLDFADGGFDETSRIKWDFVIDPGRETLRKQGYLGLHGIGNVQSIRTWSEEYTDPYGSLAIEGRLLFVTLGAEFKPGHVTQTQRARRATGADDDFAEFLWRRKTSGGDDRNRESLSFGRRLLAKSPSRILVIGRADGFRDVTRGHAEARHLVGL